MQILREVQSLVCLDLGWCLLLLRHFKWDKDYLRENYFNNNQIILKNIGFTPNNDLKVSLTKSYGQCVICCCQNVLCANICGHQCCLQCWMGHIKMGVQQKAAFMMCMQGQCPAPLLYQAVKMILGQCGHQGKIQLRKYQKKICQSFITSNKNYQFCTGIDCGNCIKINTKQLQTVQCTCGKIFCFKCQSDDHYPCLCQQKDKWIQQVVKEQADMKWISANAKICPWCKKAVQRSQGCNFMSCTCGKTFCYMCSQPWQPDHKDHFKCHIYKKLPDQTVNKQKQILQRMNHCTQRYLFNQAVANNYRTIDVFEKRKYLFNVLSVDLTQSQFMETAYKFAIQCCEKLKWIYAFTYFYDMKQNKLMKDTFEFSLGQYQKFKQNLLKLLAADLKKFIMDVQKDQKQSQLTQYRILLHRQYFLKLKNTIVNYFTCTKTYKDKFVDELKKITRSYAEEKERKELEMYMEGEIKKMSSQGKKEEKGKKGGKKEKKEEKKEKKGGLLGAIFG